MRSILERFRKIEVRNSNEAKPLNIVADGAIASEAFAHGRLLPVVIVDASQRPDVIEFFRVHGHIPTGDVVTRWGRLKGTSGRICLIATFERPLHLTAAIEFEVERHGMLIETMLLAGAFYLQAGVAGDTLTATFNEPRVIVEVEHLTFRPHWNKMLEMSKRQTFREMGLDRAASKRAAKEFIREVQTFAKIQLGHPSGSQ